MSGLFDIRIRIAFISAGRLAGMSVARCDLYPNHRRSQRIATDVLAHVGQQISKARTPYAVQRACVVYPQCPLRDTTPHVLDWWFFLAFFEMFSGRRFARANRHRLVRWRVKTKHRDDAVSLRCPHYRDCGTEDIVRLAGVAVGVSGCLELPPGHCARTDPGHCVELDPSLFHVLLCPSGLFG